jgi:hypothetical protein
VTQTWPDIIEVTADELNRLHALADKKAANYVQGCFGTLHGMNASRTEALEWIRRGTVGEFVFNRWLGTQWMPSSAGRVDIDFGANIDIKAGRWPHSDLLVQQSNLKDNYVYVLVVPVHSLAYRVAGWEWGSELRKHLNLDIGKGTTKTPPYTLPQSQLRAAPRLFDLLQFAVTAQMQDLIGPWITSRALPKIAHTQKESMEIPVQAESMWDQLKRRGWVSNL